MTSGKITDVRAREIIDCRGWPTVQADVYVDGRLMGRADVPAGRSTGAHEAFVLTDGDPKRYRGLGVRKAVANVEGPIRNAIVGREVTDQRKIDFALVDLDGARLSGATLLFDNRGDGPFHFRICLLYTSDAADE